MSFARTETQTMLSDMLGRLLAEENEFEARRKRLQGSTPDRLALWPALAEQGVLGAALPEEAGGFGGAARDLAVVMEHAGASLVVEPLLSSAVSARVLLLAGFEAELAALVAGERVFVFAHAEGFDPYASRLATAERHGERFALSGTKAVIRHADLAQELIVTASLDGKSACFLVTADAPGVALESFRLLDGSSAANITFDQAPARFLAGEAAVADALLWSIAGLAAEIAGIIPVLNQATFAYLNTRKQFGVPLASFQALQHRAADMFAAGEEIKALANRAFTAIDGNTASRFALASATKALADEAGRKVGHEAVQLHGGMGVSDELNVSHYLRRLATIRAEYGSADTHRTRFATLEENHAA